MPSYTLSVVSPRPVIPIAEKAKKRPKVENAKLAERAKCSGRKPPDLLDWSLRWGRDERLNAENGGRLHARRRRREDMVE
jgi:hypothetical protein